MYFKVSLLQKKNSLCRKRPYIDFIVGGNRVAVFARKSFTLNFSVFYTFLNIR